MRPRAAAALLALAAGLARGASAQPTLDLSLGGSLQSLETPALGTVETQSTLAGGAAAGVDFALRRGHVGYGLDAGSYAAAGDWSYRLHRLDARYRLDVSPSTRVHLGADGALRRNGEAWQDADYDGLGAFVNLEASPRAGFTLRTGYRVDRRAFDDMRSLDQTEHGLFASILVNLPSRTTLIVEARGGVKGYRGETVGPAVPEAGAEEDVPAGRSSGGAGAGSGSAGQGRGSGATSGASATGPDTRPPAPADGSPTSDHAQQLTLLARVAQSLGERTGLSLQATWRGTDGSVPPAVVTTPAGFFDDGVYDDPYASDLVGAEVRLKHVRPGGGVIEASARRFVQSYTAALALAADGLPRAGGPLREDRVWRALASLELPILPSRTGPLAVGLQLGYAFTDSSSNDAFYDYRNHSGAIALRVGY